jgi:hypothetical protein
VPLHRGPRHPGRRLRAWVRFSHTGEAGGLPGETIAALAANRGGGPRFHWFGDGVEAFFDAFLPDLPRTSMRFIALEGKDGRLDLDRQVVAMPGRDARCGQVSPPGRTPL